jgi:hypothetical protein
MNDVLTSRKLNATIKGPNDLVKDAHTSFFAMNETGT